MHCSSSEAQTKDQEKDGIDVQGLVTLEKLNQNQRQDYLHVSSWLWIADVTFNTSLHMYSFVSSLATTPKVMKVKF